MIIFILPCQVFQARIVVVIVIDFSNRNLLGVTLQDNPCNWDLHFEEMLKKASGRMYIMRVCRYYGLSIKRLDLLFDSLIMSIFTFAIELWGCAYDGKYLNQIDKFIKRAHRNGYI